MQRYFVNQVFKTGDIVKLNTEDFHHIKSVMRMKIGDLIEVVGNDELVGLAKIVDLNDAVNVSIVEIDEVAFELNLQVFILQGLVKSDKFEHVLQKGTELGAYAFVPLNMKRSITKLSNEKFMKKQVRWQKIVKEASEQSKRCVIPKVYNLHGVDNVDELGLDKIIVCYEDLSKDKSYSIKKILNDYKNEIGLKIGIVIGPEGGIDSTEIKTLENIGADFVSLGTRILRTETVATFVLSIINYECGL